MDKSTAHLLHILADTLDDLIWEVDQHVYSDSYGGCAYLRNRTREVRDAVRPHLD